MAHVSQFTKILLPILSLVLVSCNKSPTNTTDPDIQNDSNSQQVLSGFGEVYRASDNALDLTPSSLEDAAILYRFNADASSDLLISDDPGNVTLTSANGAITLRGVVSEGTSETWTATVDAGSWEVRYDATDSQNNHQALAFVRFSGSRYFLDIEKSSRVLESGREILLRAYITTDAVINEFGVFTNGQLTIPEQAQINVTVTLPNGQNIQTGLLDNGQEAQGDLLAGDGQYSARLNWTMPGNYELNITADASVAGNQIQRSQYLHDNLSGFRAELATSTTQALTGRVFEQNLSEGQYAVPIIVTFDNTSIPDYVSVLAEIWATDNVGEQIRIVDHITGLLHPEDLGDGTHGLPLLIQSRDVPTNTGRFSSVELRIIQFSDIDNGDEILFGTREVLVTGLPE